LRDTTSGVGGKREVLDLTCLNKGRREQETHTYFRMFNNRLKPELKKAYAEHIADATAKGAIPDLLIAFRPAWLATKLKDEPEDVRQTVSEGRRSAEDKAKDQFNLIWEDQDECDETELQRRARAYRTYMYVLIQTLRMHHSFWFH
jgi:hypothetical protein